MTKTASFTALVAACGALALAACSQEASPPETPAAPTLHQVMVERIDQPADALWEVTNAAIDDNAALDPAKLGDDGWARIAELAATVEDGARTLAALDPIVVAAPGVKISDADIEGGHTAAQVQGFVDADPATFRNLATTLADHMATLRTAARDRDVATASRLVNELDGVCETCHLSYWYPEQAELVRSIRAAGGDDPAPQGSPAR